MKTKALSLAFLCLPFSAVSAGAYFLDMGGGARAAGLGGAFTAIADNAYAPYYNPAGLAQLTQTEVSASYAQLLTGLSDGSNLGLSQLAYAQPLENGKQGTLAVNYQNFGLSQVYNEQSFYLSYGRKILDFKSGGSLMLGANAKYLSHGFQPGSEASNSCQGFNCTFGVDPVLAGRTTQGAPDADLGLLYRSSGHLQAGLMVEHLMQPNVAFSGTDKLPLNFHAGIDYSALWMNLTAQVDDMQLADGTQGQDFIIAAERYFPTLDYGEFGIRGSFGYGSESWRQLTLGLSYIINKLEFNYAFVMPIGGIATSAGTQRADLTFRFGKPNPREVLTADLMDKARKIRDGLIPVGLNLGQISPHDLSDPKLAQVRVFVKEGQFTAAYEQMKSLMPALPKDISYDILLDRLNLIAEFYPSFQKSKESWSKIMFAGLGSFIKGRDRHAMLRVSYAESLNPDDTRIEKMLSKLEAVTQIKADRVSPNSPLGFIGEFLYRAEAADDSMEYPRVKQILANILYLEPNNTVALERLGSVDYITKDYAQAVKAWEKALETETSPEETASLKNYLQLAKDALAHPQTSSLPVSTEKQVQNATQAPTTQNVPAAPAPQITSRDRAEIARLYKQGVDDYAAGNYLNATAAFLKILEIDPNNAEANKALERINQVRGRQ